MSNIFKILKGKNDSTIPVWLMRQAGRYLPEYIEIRSSVNDFLELCYDTKKATAVTLQPINRFSLDAAIVFADILILPDALGWKVKFKKNYGPVLEKFESPKDMLKLSNNFLAKVNHVYDTVSNVKSSLPKNTPLIGFAGSPWTVISYMLEGRGKTDFSISKKFLYEHYHTSVELFNFITDKTIDYLSMQIESGADIIKLFDSWSGILNGSHYEDFVIKPTQHIVNTLKTKYPHIPIIGFPKNSGFNYNNYINNIDIDVVSVDQFTPLAQMKKWQDKIVVQGNLDPVILLTNKERIKLAVDEIMSIINKNNFIFNLGHGVMPETDPKNVEFLVNYVREFKK